METVQRISSIKTRSDIIVAAGTLLANNSERRGLFIQNLNNAPLFVKFGDEASTTDFDFILQAGTAADDGKGGIFISNVLSYTGVITVAGVSVKCKAFEL